MQRLQRNKAKSYPIYLLRHEEQEMALGQKLVLGAVTLTNYRSILFLKNILYWLCSYSCLNFFPFAPLYPALPTPPQAIPTLLFMSMGHVYKFCGYSISSTVLYIPWLFCDHQFVLLNPLTSSPFPHTLPQHSNHLKWLVLVLDLEIPRGCQVVNLGWLLLVSSLGPLSVRWGMGGVAGCCLFDRV